MCLKRPGDLPFLRLEGLPASGDVELDTLMNTARGLSRGELENLVSSMLRAALAAERSGSAGYLSCLAADALVTMRLHTDPEYEKALRESPGDPAEAVDVEQFLARYGL